MLKFIKNNYPQHQLIISDFDKLNSSVSLKQGINAPIVSRKLEGPA